MRVSELKIQFSKSYDDQTTYTPVTRPPQKPSHDRSYRHNIYHVNQLNSLIETLKELSCFDENDRLNKYSIRYLVTPDEKLLLAREGKPGRDIPGHKEICNRSLAAGNIFFSDDFSEITKINHQSGDFCPDVGSMVWAIAILLKTNVSLAKKLIIETSYIDEQGGFKVDDNILTFSRVELVNLIPTKLLAEDLPALNNDSSVQVNEYKDDSKKRKRYGFFNPCSSPFPSESLADILMEINNNDFVEVNASQDETIKHRKISFFDECNHDDNCVVKALDFGIDV